MLSSDGIGIIAGILLAIPPIKDQYYRYQSERERIKAETSPIRVLRLTLSTAWNDRRQDYDGKDTFCLAAGSLGLIVSFILKAVDL
jgi:hypothetical protein